MSDPEVTLTTGRRVYWTAEALAFELAKIIREQEARDAREITEARRLALMGSTVVPPRWDGEYRRFDTYELMRTWGLPHSEISRVVMDPATKIRWED